MLVESHPGHPIIELTLKSISQATLFFTLSVVDDFAGDVAYSELKQTFACRWVGEQGIERLYVRSDELFQGRNIVRSGGRILESVLSFQSVEAILLLCLQCLYSRCGSRSRGGCTRLVARQRCARHVHTRRQCSGELGCI